MRKVKKDVSRVIRQQPILGKFYMFRKELGKAEVEFKKIIDKEGSLFGLMENWADNFDGMHKNNKESHFLRFQFYRRPFRRTV